MTMSMDDLTRRFLALEQRCDALEAATADQKAPKPIIVSTGKKPKADGEK